MVKNKQVNAPVNAQHFFHKLQTEYKNDFPMIDAKR